MAPVLTWAIGGAGRNRRLHWPHRRRVFASSCELAAWVSIPTRTQLISMECVYDSWHRRVSVQVRSWKVVFRANYEGDRKKEGRGERWRDWERGGGDRPRQNEGWRWTETAFRKYNPLTVISVLLSFFALLTDQTWWNRQKRLLYRLWGGGGVGGGGGGETLLFGICFICWFLLIGFMITVRTFSFSWNALEKQSYASVFWCLLVLQVFPSALCWGRQTLIAVDFCLFQVHQPSLKVPNQHINWRHWPRYGCHVRLLAFLGPP